MATFGKEDPPGFDIFSSMIEHEAFGLEFHMIQGSFDVLRNADGILDGGIDLLTNHFFSYPS